MVEDRVKSIQDWRRLRGLSEEELALMVGTGARTIVYWERTGYDPTDQCAIALATALQAPVDTIRFGRYVRGVDVPGCQFILAARGRDDWGWKARIVEWQADELPDPWFAERANDGWLEPGQTAEAALDRVEHGIRTALARSRVACVSR